MSVRQHFVLRRGFLSRDGPARARGEAACQRKLCFTAIDIEKLAALIYELSLRDDCWAAKLDSELAANGMVRGRVFLTSEDAVAEVWREYKVTDVVFCTIQDDDFANPRREEG